MYKATILFFLTFSSAICFFGQGSPSTPQVCKDYAGQVDQAEGQKISIDVKGFTGAYWVASETLSPNLCSIYYGASNPRLRSGRYVILVGSDLGHHRYNLMKFNVDVEKGGVIDFSNEDAIEPTNFPTDTIKFRNVPILVDPKGYQGNFSISAPKVGRPCTDSTKPCQLIPNLAYYLSFEGYQDHTFYFFVDKHGKIPWTSSFYTAWGSGSGGPTNVLKFRTQSFEFSASRSGVWIQIGANPFIQLSKAKPITIVRNIPNVIRMKLTSGGQTPSNGTSVFFGHTSFFPTSLRFNFGGSVGAVTLSYKCLSNCPKRLDMDLKMDDQEIP